MRNAATQRELENAFEAGLAVEGKVESAIKGGYEVRIARERAFCPLSQIDIARTADPAVHVGKTYTFRIIEYKDGGKSIVVSRRKQLEEEQQASAAAVRTVDRAWRGADRAGWRRCSTSAPSSIWVAAFRAFFTCPT